MPGFTGPGSNLPGNLNVRAQVLSAISKAAKDQHVPVEDAIAIALVESHLDPNAEGDPGYFIGNRFYSDPKSPPTSFGLYQLHEHGLLGHLTPAQAKNPLVNAEVALAHLHATMVAHPEIKDPGVLAALSQGPANPKAYAAEVDKVLGPGPDGTNSEVHTVSHGQTGTGTFFGFITDPLAAVAHFFELIYNGFTNADTWKRIGLGVGGLVLVLLGVKVALG